MTIDTDNISKTSLKMAARRGVNLSDVEIERKGDVIFLHSEMQADELVEELEEVANEYCGGDFSKISVDAHAEASMSTLYGQTSAGLDELNVTLYFQRDETDEEAARRFLREFDRKR